MAIAGLGLLVGDVSTAGAILRPDYATGPGLAFPLETLQAIALCIRHGIVIRDPEAIERLATTDLLILDHHPALERTELEVDAVAGLSRPYRGRAAPLRRCRFPRSRRRTRPALRGACRDPGNHAP